MAVLSARVAQALASSAGKKKQIPVNLVAKVKIFARCATGGTEMARSMQSTYPSLIWHSNCQCTSRHGARSAIRCLRCQPSEQNWLCCFRDVDSFAMCDVSRVSQCQHQYSFSRRAPRCVYFLGVDPTLRTPPVSLYAVGQPVLKMIATRSRWKQKSFVLAPRESPEAAAVGATAKVSEDAVFSPAAVG